MPKSLAAVAFLVLPLLPVGCGGETGKKTVAKLTGSVTFAGQPVTGGLLYFTPKAKGSDPNPGKSATGELREDGSFVARTYAQADGAVVGTHTVSYEPPPPKPANEQSGSPSAGHDAKSGPAVASPFAGLVPKVKEVEVESGGTTLEIELVKP